MDCPGNLVFNEFVRRCDYTTEPIAPTNCNSHPCQNGARCVDLPNSDYRCECTVEFHGKNCDLTPDVCINNRCGSNGVCHPLPYRSVVPYYCTCSDDSSFGLACDQSVERNPCIGIPASRTTSILFSTRIHPSLFVQCDGNIPFVKACSKSLVFSKSANKCDYTASPDSNKPNSTEINYYTRPYQLVQYNQEYSYEKPVTKVNYPYGILNKN